MSNIQLYLPPFCDSIHGRGIAFLLFNLSNLNRFSRVVWGFVCKVGFLTKYWVV